jgi:hypothetical protein
MKPVPKGTGFFVFIFLLSRRCARKRRNKELEETKGRDSERIIYARLEDLRLTKKSAVHRLSQPEHGS